MELKIGQTSLRCAVFSSTLFWLLISANESFGVSIIFFWFISLIITFVISLIMNAVTISVFYEFEKERLDKTQFYKRYFPFYAIVFFSLSVLLYTISNFEKDLLYILVTAFFTAMMSWIWLFKENKSQL